MASGVVDPAAELLAGFVARLSPAGSAVTPVNSAAGLAEAAAGLTPGAVGWAVALGRRCSDATRVSQGLDADQLGEDDTRHAVETSMLGLLRRLSGDDAVPPLNDRQLTMARTMARLGWPYERYVTGLRIAQDMALDALLASAAGYRPADALPGLLRAVTGGVAAYFDDSVRAVIAEYLAERQRAIAQSLAERRRVIAALVAGEHVPHAVAATTLGVDLSQHHLALILWRPADDGLAAVQHATTAWSKGQLELAVSRAAGTLRVPATLTMPADDHDGLLCWLTSPLPFPAGYLETLTELFGTDGGGGGGAALVAVGLPGQGSAGFRRSHLAALDAHRIARLGRRAAVTGYADVGAIALLSADPERARWFVAEELGPLGGEGPSLDDLRATALAYLDSGRNLVDTARRLHVHRNTVVYRLAKIERLLGRPLDQRPFATQAALALAARLTL